MLTCNSYGQCDVNSRQKPEQDDGEEAAHGEQDQRPTAVHDGADEKEEAEDWAQAEEGHRYWPPYRLQVINTKTHTRVSDAASR